MNVFLTFLLGFFVQRDSFDRYLEKMTRDFSVPQTQTISSDSTYILIDTREKEEFDVSHIQGARNIPYASFNLESMSDISKKSMIVVYCSVGYRSNKIAEKLMEAGYTNVQNLYGGIFKWVNDGENIYSDKGKTDTLHVYNFLWGRYVFNTDVKKVY